MPSNLAPSPPVEAPQTEGPATGELAQFAAKLRVGQVCEGGCSSAAHWAAVAPDRERWGCDIHIGALMDDHYIWFLHPLGNAA